MKNMFQGLMLSLLVSFFAACNPHDSYCERDEMKLKDAAREDDTDAIGRLQATGVGLDAQCEQENHHPAIVLAARDGQLKAVQSLIEKEANINVKTVRLSDLGSLEHIPRGATALAVAADKGHEEIVNKLLLAGALVDEADEIGWTPLMKAAWWGRPKIVKLLIQHRADVNLRSHYRQTALSLARKKVWGKKRKTRRELVRILKKEEATEDLPRSSLNYVPRITRIIRGLGNRISFLLGL